MNDLEIIKQLCDVDVPYNEICSIEANALGEIQEAAERMANRIAELERAISHWYDENQDSLKEITRLQDKIEKYNCADCKNLKGPNDANCVECLNGVFDYMSINNLSICALKCGLWEAKSGGK